MQSTIIYLNFPTRLVNGGKSAYLFKSVDGSKHWETFRPKHVDLYIDFVCDKSDLDLIDIGKQFYSFLHYCKFNVITPKHYLMYCIMS